MLVYTVYKHTETYLYVHTDKVRLLKANIYCLKPTSINSAGIAGKIIKTRRNKHSKTGLVMAGHDRVLSK